MNSSYTSILAAFCVGLHLLDRPLGLRILSCALRRADLSVTSGHRRSVPASRGKQRLRYLLQTLFKLLRKRARRFRRQRAPLDECLIGKLLSHPGLGIGGEKAAQPRETGDGATLGTVPVGKRPIGLAFDGAYIWVTNQFSNSVTKLRAFNGANLGSFAVGDGPFGLAFDGSSVWVANFFSKNVTKLRASDGANLGTFAVGDGAAGVAFDGVNIWVANNGSNTVTKLRPVDDAVLGTYNVSRGPFGVAFDGLHIWVANFGTNTVSKL